MPRTNPSGSSPEQIAPSRSAARVNAENDEGFRRSAAENSQRSNEGSGESSGAHSVARLAMVQLARESTGPGGRDRYACSSATWDLLIEIGETFGWKPRGTTYLPARGAHSADSDVRHNYQPGDDRDYKRVEADDAIEWAMALREARRSPHLAAMIGARADFLSLPAAATSDDAKSANAPVAAVMEEFIEYAGGGAFSFARSA